MSGTVGDGSNPFMMGTMTPDQQQQMMRNMYAMSLMGRTTGSTQPQSSFVGGMNQGMSPILNAMMLRNMMGGQQQAMPTSAPQGFGVPAANTGYNAMTGYTNMAGGAPQGMNIASSMGGAAAGPGLMSRIGSWLGIGGSGS